MTTHRIVEKKYFGDQINKDLKIPLKLSNLMNKNEDGIVNKNKTLVSKTLNNYIN